MVAVGGMELGPGFAAVAVLFLSLAAKLFMSFGIRIKQKDPKDAGYEPLSQEAEGYITNCSKAQLNVAEYEGLFLAIFLFLYLQKSEGLLVTIVCIWFPIAQAVYFWGRVLTGQVIPWAPLGALSRYIIQGISIYLVGNEVGVFGSGMPKQFGPGGAAVAVIFLSLAAKMYMSFGIRVQAPPDGVDGPAKENASAAQLNVKEYEGLFTAIFLFLYLQKVEGLLVTIVCIWFPIAQAIYFWGRVISGNVMPWAPMGALSRYVIQGIIIYLVSNEIFGSDPPKQWGPGGAAVAIIALSLAAKMFMSFGIRIRQIEGEQKVNASKAQLNVAEYEDVFTSVFLFLYMQKADNILVTIISYVFPIAQAVYFWGRVISGSVMPWAPMGALPRYIGMGITVYILYTQVQG